MKGQELEFHQLFGKVSFDAKSNLVDWKKVYLISVIEMNINVWPTSSFELSIIDIFKATPSVLRGSVKNN